MLRIKKKEKINTEEEQMLSENLEDEKDNPKEIDFSDKTTNKRFKEFYMNLNEEEIEDTAQLDDGSEGDPEELEFDEDELFDDGPEGEPEVE